MTSQNQKKIVAVFDVDSSSVGVSVVAYQSGEKLPVHEYFSVRREILFQDNIETFFASTLRTITSLGEQALTESAQTIDGVYLVLGAPWASSQLRTAYYQRNHDFIFNEDLAKEIIDKELREPLSKNLDFHEFSGLTVFERKTVEVKVNGYSTLTPFDPNRKVKDVELHSLSSVISQTTLDSLVHTIERIFHRAPILVSNAFVSYQMHTNFFPHSDSGVILDVGGTNTQVYRIDHDHLRGLATLPVGREQIIKGVMDRAMVTREKARSLLRLYIQEQILDDRYRNELTTVMEEVYRTWMENLYLVIDTLAASGKVSSDWFLIAPDDVRSWLGYHILKTEELRVHLKLGSPIRLTDVSRVLGIESRERGLEHLADPEMVPVLDAIGVLLQKDKGYGF